MTNEERLAVVNSRNSLRIQTLEDHIRKAVEYGGVEKEWLEEAARLIGYIEEEGD